VEHFADTHKTLIALHLQTGTSYKQMMEPESWVLSQHICDHLCAKRQPGAPKLVLFMTNRPSVYYSPPECVYLPAALCNSVDVVVN
jgi:hypothetical protein